MSLDDPTQHEDPSEADTGKDESRAAFLRRFLPRQDALPEEEQDFHLGELQDAEAPVPLDGASEADMDYLSTLFSASTDRREFTRLSAATAAGVLAILSAACKNPFKKEKRAKEAPGDPHVPPDMGVPPRERGPETGYNLDEARFSAVAEDITHFFACLEGARTTDCELYERYARESGGSKILRIDVFRTVLLRYIEEKMELTPYEKFMLRQNAVIFAHVIHFLHMSRTGHQHAGGKKQVSGVHAFLNAYESYRKRSEISKMARDSEDLEEIMDPLTLMALIGAETDFVNFNNRREGVQGDFQFTSMKPPVGTHYVPGANGTLSPIRATYNRVYDQLDDMADGVSKKNIALCVAWVRTLEKQIESAFSRDDAKDESVRENFSFLMALTFYNSDISKRVGKPEFMEDVRNQPSSFISHLNFTYGARAGKLYVPAIITYYILLREYERTGSSAISADDMTLRAFALCFSPNFGLDGSKTATVPVPAAPMAPIGPETEEPEPAAPTVPAPKPPKPELPPVAEPKPKHIPPPVRHEPKPGSVRLTVAPRLTKSQLVSTYFRSYDELYDLNPRLKRSVLQAHSTVVMPDRYAWSTVKKGDTAHAIARRAGTDLDTLRTLNKLQDWKTWTSKNPTLKVGTRVIVPKK